MRVESNDAEGSKRLQYKCNTTKTLDMSRVFLVEKEKEKEKEPVRKNFFDMLYWFPAIIETM